MADWIDLMDANISGTQLCWENIVEKKVVNYWRKIF
jgi:hypothetical protein